MKRNLESRILKDLKSKLVFLVGPRQVGKTWLSKEIMKKYASPLYLNYDNLQHRQIMKNYSWLPENDLLVFDEIHKMKGWKNYLKGVYDTKKSGVHVLVTGSARLNAHKNIGDSLAGRFFVHHLFPFTLNELKKVTEENGSEISDQVLSDLFNRGGFPEPFLDRSLELERWRNLYADSLLREDVLSLESIENLNALRNIYEILKTKVGSPVSYSNIAGDLGISPITVKKYVALLEALYIVFIIKPYSKKISRSILKEPKIYFYDYSAIEDLGKRFENFVAIALLAQVKYKEDVFGKPVRLHYLKTKEGHETDFAVIMDNEVQKILEVKFSDSEISKSLKYFVQKYNFPAVQIIYNAKNETKVSLIEVRNVKYLANDII